MLTPSEAAQQPSTSTAYISLVQSRLGAAAMWPLKRLLRRVGLLALIKRALGAPPPAREADRDLRIQVSLADSADGLDTWKDVSPTEMVTGGSIDSRRAPAVRSSHLLLGGWGYGNLGDEAILAGYLLDGRSRGVRYTVASIDARRTRRALGVVREATACEVIDESFCSLTGTPTASRAVIAGGGYLNGTWGAEIGGKLTRLGAITRGREVVLHAVEVRDFSRSPARAKLSGLLERSAVSVRDVPSADEVTRLTGDAPPVLPDAISLIAPYVHSLVGETQLSPATLLVNLLDVTKRSDVHEAEFAVDAWADRCRELVSALGPDVVGIALDDDDAVFMTELGIRVAVPRTVQALVSLLGSGRGLITTRMHPALLSTMLNKPTWALPYCGKVRPTLTRLGLSEVVTAEGDILHATASPRSTHFESIWRNNYAETAAWLYEEGR